MANGRSKPADADAEAEPAEPGAGNGLDHVRSLFRVRFPAPWPHGFLSRTARNVGVDPELVLRLFKASPGFAGLPKAEIISDLAKVLDCSNALVAFAFLADLRPDAVDADMWAVLEDLAYMTPAQLRKTKQETKKITKR